MNFHATLMFLHYYNNCMQIIKTRIIQIFLVYILSLLFVIILCLTYKDYHVPHDYVLISIKFYFANIINW